MREQLRTVHESVLAAAGRYPDTTAVVCESERLTYAELVDRADALARRLRSLNLRCEEPVGLLVDRSAGTVVGALAVLMAGGCYAPMHERLPAARVRALLEHTRIRIVLRSDGDDRVPDDVAAEVITLGDWSVAAGATAPDDPGCGDHPVVHPEALVYVSFTSGTTGTPKGVCVPHSCVVNYLDGAVERLGFQAGWRHLLVPSIAFDLSVSVVWGALVSGGTLHLPPEEVVFDPDELAAYVAGHRIDALKLTPSHLAQLPHGAGIEGLRSVFVGGEAPDPKVLLHWAGAVSGELFCGYGTTESTGATTLSLVRPEDGETPLRSIGSPLPGCSVTAVSERGERIEPGGLGELLVRGNGITRGYYRDPRLTAQRFVPDPDRPGRRCYRTGDAVRVTDPETFEFRGRIDAQINLNGYRVEPGEVEEALERHPAIRRAAVLALNGALVAAVETDGSAPDRRQLRAFVGDLLPSYEIPGEFVRVSRVPLGANGKLDRGAIANLVRDELTARRA